MAREPHYPEEAAVGSDSKPAPDSEAGAGGKAPESRRTKHLVTGAAIGIGSAAIVAALLFANRSRKS